eukprot:gnl/TRDRNA2_/TRDRNA2_163997_c1_seq1.p1 gnl/TRDRNA2_/TRDRNA2_163997_c1~~gnl/TRDRNA2_/TRDRNA2_163997_c1_seq1.p1  ORF type:complete len:586 (-),score=127.39 gnl/TRDRNA2_/TRDRNA2_163997_c1_seq1:50-1549(-)
MATAPEDLYKVAEMEPIWQPKFNEERSKAKMREEAKLATEGRVARFQSTLAVREQVQAAKTMSALHLACASMPPPGDPKFKEHQRGLAEVIGETGGHIALISCTPDHANWSQIAAILKTLRTPARPWEHRPIMVLEGPDDPPTSLAEEFYDVVFLNGVATNMEDLETMCVDTAAEIVLLAGDAPSAELTDLQDHFSVAVANTVEMLLKSSEHESFTLYELHNEGSVAYLPSINAESMPEQGASTNGGGPLAIQNGSVDYMIDEEIMGSSSNLNRKKKKGQQPKGTAIGMLKAKEASEAVKMNIRFCCGQVFSLSFLGEMLGREYYVPSTMELMQALVMPARRGQLSFPWLVPVPPKFEGKPFMELLKDFCLAEDMALPLGIYRPLFPRAKMGLRRAMGYVVTNPTADMVLTTADQVYVLASAQWGRRMLQGCLTLSSDGEEPLWRKKMLERSTELANKGKNSMAPDPTDVLSNEISAMQSQLTRMQDAVNLIKKGETRI